MLRPVLIYVVPLIFVVAAAGIQGIEPQLFPDSESYLKFFAIRSSAYPLFLEMIERLGGSLVTVVILQYLIFAGSMIAFSAAIARFFDAGWIAVLACFAVVFNPFTLAFHTHILSESLFFSVLLLVVGVILDVIRTPTVRKYLMLGLLMGAAYSIRPVAVSLFPLVLFLLWGTARPLEGNRVKSLMAACIGIVSLLAADMISFKIWHGEGERRSPLPLTLFAKAGLIDVPDGNPYAADEPLFAVWEALEHGYAEPRKLIAQTPGLAAESFFTRMYEIYAQHQFARDEVGSAKKAMRALGHDSSVYTVMEDAALARIAQNPMGYIKLAWVNYYTSWSMFNARFPLHAPVIEEYLQKNRPLPVIEGSDLVPETVQSSKLAALILPGMWGMAIFTIGYILMGLYRGLRRAGWKESLSAPFIFALLIQGNLVLISLTGVGFSRYTLSLWPVMVLFGLLVIRHLVESYAGYRRISG